MHAARKGYGRGNNIKQKEQIINKMDENFSKDEMMKHNNEWMLDTRKMHELDGVHEIDPKHKECLLLNKDTIIIL